MELKFSGSEFQMIGPLTEMAFLPMLDFLCGTAKERLVTDLVILPATGKIGT